MSLSEQSAEDDPNVVMLIQGIANWLTSISAILLSLANGTSMPFAAAFIIFGLLVDIFRRSLSRPAQCTTLSRITGISLVNMPRLSLYVLIGVIVFLIMSYFMASEICPQTLNHWLEDNFSLARQRMERLGGSCEVPHGAIILLMQTTLPVALLLCIAIDTIAFSIDQCKFYNSLKFYRFPSQVPLLTVSKAAGLLLFFIVSIFLQRIIVHFDPIGTTDFRPVTPQNSVFFFIITIAVYTVPVVYVTQRFLLRLCLTQGKSVKS